MDFSSPQFWVALLQIIAIDIVLGGDNAVIIGMACRRLPERERRLGILWGMVGAIGLRVVLIFFAVSLLAVPYLKIIGALLLVWIGVKLLLPEPEGAHDVQAGTTLMSAIKTIIVADAVMSLDNVIAIAGAAHGNLFLVIFGLVISIPIIVYGSQMVIKLMERFPVVIVAGGALMGWIAGGMIVTDVSVEQQVMAAFPMAKYVGPIAGALFVVLLGKMLAARTEARREKALVDLANNNQPSNGSK